MSGLVPPPKPERCESIELAVSPAAPVYTKPTAGLPAVINSLVYTAETAGLIRGTRALLKVNQVDGFDCPGCAWPEPGHRAVAEFCENGARAVAHEADRRRVDAAFFRAHSLEELRTRSGYWLEQQGRLVEPMIKRAGATHYEPISYAEAFSLVGDTLRELPPARLSLYTSGRASNEAAFLYQLFARAFGTNNLPDCSNLCHESSGKGLGNTIGVGKGTVSLEDFEHADCIFLFGQNPGTNHPRMLSTLADAVKRGARVVAVNPIRERGLETFAHPQKVSGMLGVGAPVATHHVQVRIGGDLAFLQGVAKCLLAREATHPDTFDRAFLAEHTTGFDAWVAALATVSFEALEAQSGVSQAAMATIADVYAESPRTIACWAMGITQHKHGVANVREIVNLLLCRGNLGKPGAGVCPVRGHSNVQGDRTMGIYEAPAPAFLDRLDAGMGIVSPRAHGHDAVGTVQAMERGDVTVFLALGGNFAAAMSDTERTVAGLRRCALTVQIATKLNKSHLETGDVALLLPCLGRTERDLRGGKRQFVTVEDSMSMVHKSEGHLPPADPGLRSECAIVAGIAAATLGEDLRWTWLAEDYDRIRDAIERSIDGFSQFNERVRQPGGFALPSTARVRQWLTPSGKAELTVNPLPTFDDLHGAPERLLLMTIRSHDQFNTTIYAMDDRYRGVYGARDVVFMHAADMAARGLAEGQAVQLVSHFGAETRRLAGFRALAFDIPRGCVAAYYPETNPLVPLESFADESRTPTSKSVAVTVLPASATA